MTSSVINYMIVQLNIVLQRNTKLQLPLDKLKEPIKLWWHMLRGQLSNYIFVKALNGQ